VRRKLRRRSSNGVRPRHKFPSARPSHEIQPLNGYGKASSSLPPLRAASLSPLLTTVDSAWVMNIIKSILAKHDDSVAPLLYYEGIVRHRQGISHLQASGNAAAINMLVCVPRESPMTLTTVALALQLKNPLLTFHINYST
jgi:hypothetical protein